MTKHSWIKRSVFAVIGGLVLAGAMGQGCPSFGLFGPAPVTVELVNVTSNPVDPLLWADPDLLFAPEDVAIDINFVAIGDPLAAGEVVTVTLDCVDAGTLLADGDLILGPGGATPSTNLLLLREGEHFICGDTVSFYYEIDQGGAFFVSVDVNDVYLAP